MGFVPLAFRAGSAKKSRVHIFWQQRIREGDDDDAVVVSVADDGRVDPGGSAGAADPAGHALERRQAGHSSPERMRMCTRNGTCLGRKHRRAISRDVVGGAGGPGDVSRMSGLPGLTATPWCWPVPRRPRPKPCERR